MSDVLALQERVRNTITLRESHFREFKSALEGRPGQKRPRSTTQICADIGEALVAFANADGGELLVGVEDDGEITGTSHSDTDIERILAAPRTHVYPGQILPILEATTLLLDDRRIAFFSVSKGTEDIFQLPDGRCVRRRDKETVPATVKQIHFDRSEVRSREFDRTFVDGATVTDLDTSLVQAVANEFLPGLSIERYLQQIGLAEYGLTGIRLRSAAILLFARDISRWHPHSHIRILKVSGTELKAGEQYNVTSDELVPGNIFTLLSKAWEALRPFLAYKTEFGRDARFEQKYTYPEWACREAIVNAIAHRDYTVQRGVDVFIFDDRMEIKNPGALLSSVSILDLEELKGAHESRNALIAKVLRENKFMRELGEGMRRMFEVMAENELQKPELRSDGTSFSVTLSHRSVFTAQQEQWLLMFQQFALSKHQKQILLLGMGDREISPSEIYKSLGTDDRNVYDREVTGLRKTGLLIEIRTNPQATSFARRNKIAKADVPRFKIKVPGVSPGAALDARPARKQTPQEFRVVASNVPVPTNEEDLLGVFSRYGRVVRVHQPVTPTSEQRGFAIIAYDSLEAARSAVKAKTLMVKGSTVSVRPYLPKRRPAAAAH